MICSVNAQNHSQFLDYAKSLPAIGAILETNSSLFLEKQALMQFYLCEQGALMIKGSNATLAGKANPEELASMLEFLGICSLKSLDTVPYKWNVCGKSLIMEYSPQNQKINLPSMMTIEQSPSMADILQIVAQVGIEEQAAENFYSETCTKRNHQKAEVWTACLQGKPVATAGAYAITETEVYLAGVVTLPEFRKQGIAGGLCSTLAEHFHQQGKKVTLMCDPQKENFYKRMGFFTAETLLISCKDR